MCFSFHFHAHAHARSIACAPGHGPSQVSSSGPCEQEDGIKAV